MEPPQSPVESIPLVGTAACWGRALNIRTIVAVLAMAITASSMTPPIDPLRILLTSHIAVQPSSTIRKRIPCSLKMASVPAQDAMMGIHPAPFLASATPDPRYTTIIKAGTTVERGFSASIDRTQEISELAEAGKFPSSTKCTA